MAHGGLRPPWKVSKESNDIALVGYQLYSVFSTENESRIDIYLRFQIRFQQGGPWESRVKGPLGRFPKHLINIRHVGYQFYTVFSTENKSLRFQIRIQQGDPWGPWVPLGRGGVSPKNLII